MNEWVHKLQNHPDYKNLSIERLNLSDRNLYLRYIANTDYDVSCWGGNFSYLWAHNFSNQLKIYKALIDEMLVTFILTKKGRLFLPCLPFGKGDPDKVLNVLIKCGEICRSWNKESNFLHKSLVNPLNTPQLLFLQQANLYNTYFTTKQLSGLERHYSIDHLISLKGKDFSKVRNKLNKFNRTFPNHILRKYQAQDFKEVINLGKLWEEKSGKKYRRILDYFYFEPLIKYSQELNQIILVIEIDNKIRGITTAEILPNDTAWGGITKYDNHYIGINEKLTVEIAKIIKRLNPKVKTINVGSDLGHEGLAFFKERFRPIYNYERFALFYI